MANTTFSGPVISDNGFQVSASGGGVTLPAYTLVESAALTATAGLVIYVSDANTGAGTIAFGNGTVFIDIKTGIQVA